MKLQLPELPFEIDALEPFISSKTVMYHHEKYHKMYVSALGKLITGTKFENTDFETIIRIAEGPVFNNAALAWNHAFYFSGLQPGNKSILNGPFAGLIKRNFGSSRFLKDTFIKSAVSLLGSGWVWLILKANGSLEINCESNAGNPLRSGLIPLLTCDLWEHAYYLDYQNRRDDYVKAFWNLINWEVIEKRYSEASQGKIDLISS